MHQSKGSGVPKHEQRIKEREGAIRSDAKVKSSNDSNGNGRGFE